MPMKTKILNFHERHLKKMPFAFISKCPQCREMIRPHQHKAKKYRDFLEYGLN